MTKCWLCSPAFRATPKSLARLRRPSLPRREGSGNEAPDEALTDQGALESGAGIFTGSGAATTAETRGAGAAPAAALTSSTCGARGANMFISRTSNSRKKPRLLSLGSVHRRAGDEVGAALLVNAAGQALNQAAEIGEELARL